MTEIGTLASLEAQLMLWMVAMIRPGAAFLAAPVFGSPSVPVQVRIIISLAIGVPALAATNFELPADGIISVAGFAMLLGEVLIGLALGFAVLIGFNAAMVSGELIGNTMGLGFAGMVDPNSGASSPALSSFLTILTTFLFLAIGGHLALAAIVIQSFKTLPPGDAWLAVNSAHRIALFGGELFAAGLAIALPVAFALVLVQIVMGLLTRSAPAMNLFSVGLPATLMAGLVLLAIAAPAMGDGIVAVLTRSLELSRDISAR